MQKTDMLNKGAGGLFRKYVALFVLVVCAALIVNGLVEIWISYREQRVLLGRLQREEAAAATAKISNFIGNIEAQIGWIAQMPWTADTLDQLHIDVTRLLRHVPAITDFIQVDAMAREQIHASRVAMDVIGSDSDLSQDPRVTQAKGQHVYYGPVYFLRGSEPYMTIVIRGAGPNAGMSIAEVNLKLVWDVISQIKVGKFGYAYVMDAGGQLIAHRDLGLVLRNVDFAILPQVRAARAAETVRSEETELGVDVQGRQVLATYASVTPLGWLVFVEQPIREAYAPLYAYLGRSGILLFAALIVASLAGLFLANRMMVPIRLLRAGAVSIGRGDFSQRISISTGDELEVLGDQFNHMAAQIQQSHANLEHKVQERTRQLELANLAKSRFLAAASHDLRQPLHALGLFVAQLRTELGIAARTRTFDHMTSAVAGMTELFNALLDISTLDAGAVAPSLTDFPVAQLFARLETMFSGIAREKGLAFRVLASSCWVHSDPILLERVLLNLVSNAVRYTTQGRVIVGCRRRDGAVRLDVCDTGVGIPQDQQQWIFGEFIQLGGRKVHGGLGLGLAIVQRLCALLDHRIELASTVGRGSRFSITVPAASARPQLPAALINHQPLVDVCRGKLVVVVDDDPRVLDAMAGLLRSWGCQVVAASSSAAIAGSAVPGRRPDLVISDYHLPNDKSGVDVIEQLRRGYRCRIPGLLITGDTTPERLRESRTLGYQLLLKPVDPMRLRATVNQLLKLGPGFAPVDIERDTTENSFTTP